MKLNVLAASLPVVRVVGGSTGRFASLCLSREALRLQGAALNSLVKGAAESFAEQRLPSNCSLNVGSSRSKVGGLYLGLTYAQVN